MRTLRLSPTLNTYAETLIDNGINGRDLPPPPPPTEGPVGEEETAFYETILIPLATALAAAYAMKLRAAPPAVDPYALDASGQPLHPEAWGVTGGGV